MYVVSETLIHQVLKEAGKDEEHQIFLQRCREVEAVYSRVMETLSEEDRTVIDSYFLASCQVQMDLLRIAYRCGMRGMFPVYPRA